MLHAYLKNIFKSLTFVNYYEQRPAFLLSSLFWHIAVNGAHCQQTSDMHTTYISELTAVNPHCGAVAGGIQA